MDSRLALPQNTILDGSYRIERVVGVGGFGITYEAEDLNLGTMVAIKEYYPFDFGDRDATMSVQPKSDLCKRTFEWGRSNFLQEARTLARFEHPNIVRVTRVFEANSTAYMVMRFEQGRNFEAWLTSLGRPPTQDELDAITAAVLRALETMHAANFLHRDIAPDNIIVRADGSPVLLDFGAARRAVAEMSQSVTGIVKPGYSPHEQYSSDSRLQGPWSDFYALGGTLYRAIAGRPPEEATLRVRRGSHAAGSAGSEGPVPGGLSRGHRRLLEGEAGGAAAIRCAARGRCCWDLRPPAMPGQSPAGGSPPRPRSCSRPVWPMVACSTRAGLQPSAGANSLPTDREMQRGTRSSVPPFSNRTSKARRRPQPPSGRQIWMRTGAGRKTSAVLRKPRLAASRLQTPRNARQNWKPQDGARKKRNARPASWKTKRSQANVSR